MNNVFDTATDPKNSAQLSAKHKSRNALSADEQHALRKQLRKREHVIEQDRNGWKAVATALTEIRDLRLYRAEGFQEFGRYCKERIRLAKSTVDRQIAIGEVYKELASTGVKTLPSTERQMRPLLCLRQASEELKQWSKNVTAVWLKAVNDAQITRKRLTEGSVLIARKQLGLGPIPKDSQPEFDLQKRWRRFEDLIWHEREFWPREQWPEFSERTVVLGYALATRKKEDVETEAPVPTSKSKGASVHPPSESQPASLISEELSQNPGHHLVAIWPRINWRLRNCDLAIIWNIKASTIRQTRWRKRHGHALYGSGKAYAKLIKEEKLNAAAALTALVPK